MVQRIYSVSSVTCRHTPVSGTDVAAMGVFWLKGYVILSRGKDRHRTGQPSRQRRGKPLKRLLLSDGLTLVGLKLRR